MLDSKLFKQSKTIFYNILINIAAYLQRGLDNIVLLDWSAFSKGSYFQVASHAKVIAEQAAIALHKLVSAGLNVDSLHVVGHSLGAQVAGFIGRYLDFELPRVTGK